MQQSGNFQTLAQPIISSSPYRTQIDQELQQTYWAANQSVLSNCSSVIQVGGRYRFMSYSMSAELGFVCEQHLTIYLELLSRWFPESRTCLPTGSRWRPEQWCLRVQTGWTMCSPGCCRTLQDIRGCLLSRRCLLTYLHTLPPLGKTGTNHSNITRIRKTLSN